MVALVRRSECVPKKLGSSPMPAIHWQTSRAYCRVVIGRSPPTTAGEEELTRLLVGGRDVAVDCLSGLFRHLEPDGLARLLLAHGCPIDSVTVGSNVFDPQGHDITSSELAIDSQIKHGQVACAPRDLQLATDRPDVLWPERRLRADQLALVPVRRKSSNSRRGLIQDCCGASAGAGWFIIRSISGPPVFRKRHTKSAAKPRNTMLNQVV